MAAESLEQVVERVRESVRVSKVCDRLRTTVRNDDALALCDAAQDAARVREEYDKAQAERRATFDALTDVLCERDEARARRDDLANKLTERDGQYADLRTENAALRAALGPQQQ